jgi:hypothetical protein
VETTLGGSRIKILKEKAGAGVAMLTASLLGNDIPRD